MSRDIKVAAHQPNLLPPLNFWAKMAQADIMVLLDQVQFVTNSSKDHYLNRCKLGDDKWFTIPVVNKYGQSIIDVQTLDAKRHFELVNRIWTDYSTDAFYAIEVLQQLFLWHVFENQYSYIVDLTIDLIRNVAGCLGIRAKIVRQSELGLEKFFDPDERLASLTIALGSSHYISGPKGPLYSNPNKYIQSGIDVSICRYIPVPYLRGTRPFFPYLSIIDAMVYHGFDLRPYFVSEIEDWIVDGKVMNNQ